MTRTISDAQCIVKKNGDELNVHFPRIVLSAEEAAPERVMSILAQYLIFTLVRERPREHQPEIQNKSFNLP